MNAPAERTNCPAALSPCRWVFAIALCMVSLACGSCRSSGPKTDPSDPIESDADPGRVPAPVAPSGRRYQAAREAVLRDDTSTAKRELTLALQENPLDAESHFLLGCLLERKGEKDQAIVAFRRTLELDPANPEALYNLGRCSCGAERR